MEAVYVMEPGSYLRREGATLKVMKGSTVLDQIPAEGLKRLMLIGYVSLSGGVLDFLIQNRVETVFMTPTGRFRARLALDEHGHVVRRMAQYLCLSDPDFALKTAKVIVTGKANNMIRFLLLRARQYNDETLKTTAVRIKALSTRLDPVKSLDGVRGSEGIAAKVWFEAYPRLLRNEKFQFSGRNKRPPLDPVNVLLSFIYTLLTNEVLSAINACGLDPYLGALHEISYGRPSLACDLVEEYRCFLGDRLVLGLINKKAINPDDFIYRKKRAKTFVDEEEMKSKRPVEMKPSIGRALVSAYEEMMKRQIMYPPLRKRITYRWLIRKQVQAFGHFLEDREEVYEPFMWET